MPVGTKRLGKRRQPVWVHTLLTGGRGLLVCVAAGCADDTPVPRGGMGPLKTGRLPWLASKRSTSLSEATPAVVLHEAAWWWEH